MLLAAPPSTAESSPTMGLIPTSHESADASVLSEIKLRYLEMELENNVSFDAGDLTSATRKLKDKWSHVKKLAKLVDGLIAKHEPQTKVPREIGARVAILHRILLAES